MSNSIIGLGADPGLAFLGISAVERFEDGSYRTRGVRVSHTEKSKEKAFSRYRASADDQRRLREHWTTFQNAMTLIKPTVVGVETYSVFTPRDVTTLQDEVQALLSWCGGGKTVTAQDLAQVLATPSAFANLASRVQRLSEVLARGTSSAIGLGQAAKTIGVFAMVVVTCFQAGIPVLVFEPSDRTRKIGGRRGASKEDVGAAVEARVHGLKEAMAIKVPQKTRRNHAHDATAFAILACEEYIQTRLDAGIRQQ